VARSDPYEAAKRVTKRHAKSFYFASPFLPREKRRHAFAVYALCRKLDDDVDEAPDEKTAIARVAAFAETLDRVYSDDQLDDDILEAARLTAKACAIPRRLFDDLAEGCRADLTVTRYADWPALEHYCYLVAGVVGLIMCRVFDLRDASAEPKAVAMGNAMQLTNICRDVKEDFERGRIYLPQDELIAAGIDEGELSRLCQGESVSDAWRGFLKSQVTRACSLYDEGRTGLAALPRDGSRQTAAVIAHVYGGINDVIESANYDVFSKRRSTSLIGKLLRAERTAHCTARVVRRVNLRSVFPLQWAA